MHLSTIGIVVPLALTLLLAPLCSDAQQPGKIPRIGWLALGSPGANPNYDAFLQGLRDLGYGEGRSIAIEQRWAEGQPDRLPALATELVQLKVDIIVAVNTLVAKAAQQATRTIPIVAYMGDAVEIGLMASLARPGGNITGVSLQIAEIAGKRLELLKEAVPQASRVAVLWNAANPNKALEWKETQIAAQALGVTLQSVEVRMPDDFEGAFSALTRGRADALITFAEALTALHLRQIADFTTTNRLPMISSFRGFVAAGGLMSYGVGLRDQYQRLAVYVDKILKGAAPADLPIEQPMKFELVINLKTAQALGLTIPPHILALADEVIQ